MTKKTVSKRVGRPSKLTPKFIKVAKEVLGLVDEGGEKKKCISEMGAIIHTDEDLLFLINDKLPEKDRVGDMTWKRWKAGGTEESKGSEFRSLIKRALTQQRAALMKKMQGDGAGVWQKWAWILERKFNEWNLQKKTLVGEDPDNKFQSVADLMKQVARDN